MDNIKCNLDKQYYNNTFSKQKNNLSNYDTHYLENNDKIGKTIEIDNKQKHLKDTTF